MREFFCPWNVTQFVILYPVKWNTFSIPNVNVIYSNTWASTHSFALIFTFLSIMCSHSFSAMCAHNFNFLNRIAHSSNCFLFRFLYLSYETVKLFFCSFTQSFNWLCLGTFNSYFILFILSITLFLSLSHSYCFFFTPLYSTHFSFYHCLVIRDLMFSSMRFTINLITMMLAISTFTLLSFFPCLFPILWACFLVQVMCSFQLYRFFPINLFPSIHFFLSNHTFVWLLSLSSSSSLLNETWKI